MRTRHHGAAVWLGQRDPQHAHVVPPHAANVGAGGGGHLGGIVCSAWGGRGGQAAAGSRQMGAAQTCGNGSRQPAQNTSLRKQTHHQCPCPMDTCISERLGRHLQKQPAGGVERRRLCLAEAEAGGVKEVHALAEQSRGGVGWGGVRGGQSSHAAPPCRLANAAHAPEAITNLPLHATLHPGLPLPACAHLDEGSKPGVAAPRRRLHAVAPINVPALERHHAL